MIDEDSSHRDQAMQAAAQVLRAGAWLIRNGYGAMQLLPYTAPSGCYWRCEFHPPERPGKSLFRYSTSSGAQYLANHGNETVGPEIDARGLGLAIMESVPDDLRNACLGEASPETLAWLVSLDATLDAGFLPSAFHDYTVDFSRWDSLSLKSGHAGTMSPQPGYVAPGSARRRTDA